MDRQTATDTFDHKVGNTFDARRSYVRFTPSRDYWKSSILHSFIYAFESKRKTYVKTLLQSPSPLPNLFGAVLNQRIQTLLEQVGFFLKGEPEIFLLLSVFIKTQKTVFFRWRFVEVGIPRHCA